MSTLLKEQSTIHLPQPGAGNLEQDEEYFEIEEDGRRRRIRFHDYGEIYSVPGLYEKLFAERLSCKSPQVVIDLLADTLGERKQDPEELSVIDFGAGNGMVGEELARIGAGSIVGVDALEEAKEAAERDRPGLYDDYHAFDVTDSEAAERRALEDRTFNCLTCVAALGFGDVPPEAFHAAYEMLEPQSWVAFNIRDQFVEDGDPSGFATLLKELEDDGELVEHSRLSYPHRLSVSGEPLNYVAVVAQKAV